MTTEQLAALKEAISGTTKGRREVVVTGKSVEMTNDYY
jgi:hypothetical protein